MPVAPAVDRRPDRWQVGDLVVDISRRAVSRGGVDLAVSGLSFDLFATLIEAAPNFVTSDELMDRVWGRVVVSPETLSQRVKLVRSALGDHPQDPRYIQGVRGRGYRLVVRPVPLPSAQPAPRAGNAVVEVEVEETPSAAEPASRDWKRLLVRALLPVVVLLAVGVWLAQRSTDESTTDESTRTGSAVAGTMAVAVMPFEYRGVGDTGTDVAVGMADAVLYRLGEMRGIEVISRRSSFSHALDGLDARELGRRLGARYLLDGSVESADGAVRVRATLTDAATGLLLWSMQVERAAGEVIATQDEIAEKVARSLRATQQGAISIGPPETSSAPAQLAMLQGMALTESARIVDLRAAVERFDEALRLDPSLGRAHAAAANALLDLYDARDDQRPGEAGGQLESVATHISRALDLSDADGVALVARARLRAARGDLAGADADFQRGIKLQPNYAAGYRHYARFLFYGLDPFENASARRASGEDEGRYRHAIQMADAARRIDPLSPANQYLRGLMAQHLGHIEQARAVMLDALTQDPEFAPVLARLGQLNWLQGRLADAVYYGERALAQDPDADWVRRLLAQFYVELGDAAAARDVLGRGKAGLRDGALVVLLYERRFDEAGRLALEDPLRQPRTWDRDVSAFALSRFAERSAEERDRALMVLRSRVAVRQEGGQRVIHHGSRFAALELARVLIAAGQQAEGHELARAVLDSVDADLAALRQSGSVQPMRADRRQRALALALLGRGREAVSVLGELVAARQLRHTWYDIQLQPAYDALRPTRAFQEVTASYRALVAEERARLDGLRARGAVAARQ